MTDLSLTIAPKSDQLNADDLIAGPRTIRITRVSGRETAEQPIAINFEGDGGKPYLPCKSMRRVLVQVWGKDGTQYPGRALTLYRDAEVLFGGLKVGGIRISHMSDISEPVTMALTATRANKKPFTVRPLAAAPAEPDAATKWAQAYLTKIDSLSNAEALETFATGKAAKLEELRAVRPELHEQVSAALERRRKELAPAGDGFDVDFGEDGRDTATASEDRAEADLGEAEHRPKTLTDAIREISSAPSARRVNELVDEFKAALPDQAAAIQTAGAERCEQLMADA